MKINQEQFNELVFFALQVHSAELQSKDWNYVLHMDELGPNYVLTRTRDTGDVLSVIARSLFCARFNWIESPSVMEHMYQRFLRQGKSIQLMLDDLGKITGSIPNNNYWSLLLDCLSIPAKINADLQADMDQIPISMLPKTSYTGLRKLSDKEYLQAYKSYKQLIIKKLNAHFHCNYDYTYLGNERPWIIKHFLEIYIPEIFTISTLAYALYYFNPLSFVAKLLAIDLPAFLIGTDLSYVAAFKILEKNLVVTDEPEFLFNPHRHVKIWLSKNKEQFMNQENQLRLIKMRANNSNDEINLIYSERLLSQEALQNLENFCKKHHINPVCIEKDIFPKCQNQTNEQKLIQLIQDEINALDSGGNLAAASDILRWLSPVYLLGTYSDMDVAVHSKNEPPVKVVSNSLLLNIGSVKQPSLETLTFNNDIISVVCPKSAAPFIDTIQNTIIQNCKLEQCFDFAIDKLTDNNAKKSNSIRLEQKAPNTDDIILVILYYITTNYPIKNLPHLRKCIQDITKTKESLITFFKLIQQETLDNDSEILTEDSRRQLQEALMKYSVIYTTGPIILKSLFDKVSMTFDEVEKNVSHMTYEKNKLSVCFSSGNSFKLHSPQHIMEQTMKGKLGESNDASWLPSGEKQIHLREENLNQKAHIIQNFFQKKMKKCSDIEKSEKKSAHKNSPKPSLG